MMYTCQPIYIGTEANGEYALRTAQHLFDGGLASIITLYPTVYPIEQLFDWFGILQQARRDPGRSCRFEITKRLSKRALMGVGDETRAALDSFWEEIRERFHYYFDFEAQCSVACVRMVASELPQDMYHEVLLIGHNKL